MAQHSPYAGLYEKLTPAQAEQYLARIRFSGPVEHTAACLERLMYCQTAAVPFENLDIVHLKATPSLAAEDLFRKIVVSRRGGFCFELNRLFWLLLEALGFSCRLAPVRILNGKSYLPPFMHCGVLVRAEGESWYCDVGYGGSPCPTIPLRIDNSGAPQRSGSHVYFTSRDEGWDRIFYEKDGRREPLFQVLRAQVEPVDFIPLAANCSIPAGVAGTRQMVSIKRPDGHASLTWEVLKVVKNGAVRETSVETEEALRRVLEEEFGICYHGPLQPWHSR